MIILDTDHISVLQHEDSPKTVVLLEKLEPLPPEEVATNSKNFVGRAFGFPPPT